MSTEPFIGEIKILGFNFAPLGYSKCQGQLMSIAQNTALFALLGTNYGGDGQTTFGLPDLQGRVPIGQGQGASLPYYTIGEMDGLPSTTLLLSNLPQHIHTLNNVSVRIKTSSGNADESVPEGNFPATTTTPTYSGNGATPNVFTGGTTVSGTSDTTGGNVPFNIMNPYLTINYSIATEGIFPSRD
jgi:microcystin-dependent protein